MESVWAGQKFLDRGSKVLDEFLCADRQRCVSEVQCLDFELERWFQCQHGNVARDSRSCRDLVGDRYTGAVSNKSFGDMVSLRPCDDIEISIA